MSRRAPAAQAADVPIRVSRRVACGFVSRRRCLVLLGRGARLPCEARDGVEVERSQRRRELLRALLHRDALAVLVLDGLEAHAHVMAAHGDAEGSSERVEEAEQKLEAVDVQLALHEIGH